jgi:hypothetical protein
VPDVQVPQSAENPRPTQSATQKVHYVDPEGRIHSGPEEEAKEEFDAIIEQIKQGKREVDALAAKKQNKSEKAIIDKCEYALKTYKKQLLNDEIEGGAEALEDMDSNDLEPAEDAVKTLLPRWIEDKSFSMAAEYVGRGWNFFRDPRVTDAIARSWVLVYQGCKVQGMILESTFHGVRPEVPM